MNRTHALSAAILALLLAGPAPAQDGTPKMTAEEQAAMAAYQKAATPGPAHARLAASAGTYDLDVRSWTRPDAEPIADKGTATRSMIMGGRMLVEDVEAQMMGMPFTGQGLRGYDNVTGKHWSTWIDSMGTGLMVGEGDCDADGACVFHGVYNDVLSGKPVTTRITTRWTSADTELFEMYGPGPDGKEAKMMEITYRKRGG
ncbi:DUF1579 domain-containing protein [Pseudoxanthomonas koreensis]|uniref:DUF1579 domain-containing protein n=1 Tax=Pseudoxanthomonas koreensis TaxID=266061 RepID=UPI0013913C3D|nr:DUF1579 domain-containing protein [Pseudoxanthomonas koreensis]